MPRDRVLSEPLARSVSSGALAAINSCQGQEACRGGHFLPSQRGAEPVPRSVQRRMFGMLKKHVGYFDAYTYFSPAPFSGVVLACAIARSFFLSLSLRFLEQERTIILAVVPANQDVATVDILERAKLVRMYS